jgi:hypothetical protein
MHHYPLRDFFLNIFLDIFDCSNDDHINFLLTFIKHEDQNPKRLMDNSKSRDFLTGTLTNNCLGDSILQKQFSMEQDYDFDCLNHETAIKILETVYSLPINKCSEEKKNRIKNYLFNNDKTLADLPFLDETLNACIPCANVNIY